MSTNKPDYIWTWESCAAFLDTAEGLIATPINTESGEEIAERIADIIALYPASANVVASLKWYNESAYRSEFERIAKYIKDGKADAVTAPLQVPSILKEYIKSRTANEQAMLVRGERVNSMLTHAMEGLRSVLSKIKEDRRVSSYAGQVGNY
jgi:hypothetical protein